MKKICYIIENINNAIKKLYYRKATENQIRIFINSSITFIILWFLVGGLFSLFLSLLVSCVIEFTYCYVPSIKYKIFGLTFKIPNYKFYFENFFYLTNQQQHKFNKEDLWFMLITFYLFLLFLSSV